MKAPNCEMLKIYFLFSPLFNFKFSVFDLGKLAMFEAFAAFLSSAPHPWEVCFLKIWEVRRTRKIFIFFCLSFFLQGVYSCCPAAFQGLHPLHNRDVDMEKYADSNVTAIALQGDQTVIVKAPVSSASLLYGCTVEIWDNLYHAL